MTNTNKLFDKLVELTQQVADTDSNQSIFDLLPIFLGLTKKYTSDEPLEDILQSVVDTMRKLVSGDHVSIRIFDRSRRELLSSARSGKGAKHRTSSFSKGEGILGWVCEHAQLVYVPDTRRDKRFATKTGQGFEILSIIAVPLISEGRVIGVSAISSEKANAFSPRDVALFELVSECARPLIVRSRRVAMRFLDSSSRDE